MHANHREEHRLMAKRHEKAHAELAAKQEAEMGGNASPQEDGEAGAPQGQNPAVPAQTQAAE